MGLGRGGPLDSGIHNSGFLIPVSPTGARRTEVDKNLVQAVQIQGIVKVYATVDMIYTRTGSNTISETPRTSHTPDAHAWAVSEGLSSRAEKKGTAV